LIKHLRAPCPCGRLRAGRPQPGTVETTTLPSLSALGKTSRFVGLA
jgi:hypothetical protein